MFVFTALSCTLLLNMCMFAIVYSLNHVRFPQAHVLLHVAKIAFIGHVCFYCILLQSMCMFATVYSFNHVWWLQAHEFMHLAKIAFIGHVCFYCIKLHFIAKHVHVCDHI